jgi:hypothetical protein
MGTGKALLEELEHADHRDDRQGGQRYVRQAMGETSATRASSQ